MDNKCDVCKSRILSHNRVIQCSFCLRLFHRTCLPLISRDDFVCLKSNTSWSCCRCNSDLFPFNHIDLHDDFINALSENWFSNDLYSLSDLNTKLFTPYEIDQSENEIMQNDFDPDTHFFNDIRFTASTSVYCCDEKFNSLLSDCNLISKTPLSFLNLNIRSIPKNIDQLSSYLSLLDISFSFIGITETWFNDLNADLYDLEGYTQEATHRSNRRGGGVSLFIKNDISFTIRNDLNIFDTFAETVFVEIDKSVFSTDKNIIIGVIYRIPDKDVKLFNDKFNDVLNNAKVNNKICYLLGDYNINLLNTDSHIPTQDFVDICFTNGFMPMINKPTRVTKYSATIIDNIITNDIIDSSFFHGLLLTDISDHFPTFLINKQICNKDITISIPQRVINTKNLIKFRDILNQHSFDNILNIQDTKEATSLFHKDITTIYNKCFPTKVFTKKYHFKKPWLTEGLKTSIKYKNVLYKRYIKNHLETDFKIYKTYRNKLHHILRCSERQHFQELISHNKNNLKKTWSIMKDIINKKKSSKRADYFIHNNKKVTDSNEISSLFNNFFANVGQSLAHKIPEAKRSAISYLNKMYDKSIFLKPTNNNELITIIKNLKTDSSCGWDELSPKVLKFCHLPLLSPLVHLLNLSLNQGVFPDELKLAKVIPLFKGGDMSIFNNYRPISVLSVLSKVFERIFYNRLLEFLNQENILYDNQFGFRKSHSTQMPLILLVDKIINEIECGNFVLGVFLDFSKAFDTVNHAILLQKLEHYGIRGSANAWVKSYLENRNQFVYYNGTKSNFQKVRCGVPQGSILGPLLFLIYINDLPSVSQLLSMFMFADDTNVFISGKCLKQLEVTMNNELSVLSEWLRSNKLSLNVSKTHFMIFSPPRKKENHIVSLNIENCPLHKVHQTKFLGVILDSKLSWKPHVAYIKGKISKSIGIIHRAKQFLNRQSLISLYYAFVYPYITYCITVWGGANNTTIHPLIVAQKRAIRCISCVPKRSSTAPLFRDLKILDFHSVYKLHVLMFVYKYNQSMFPSTFNDFFTMNADIHRYSTRQTSNFYPPRYKLDVSQTGFKYNGCKFWNSLSSDVKNLHVSHSTFKKRLIGFFTNKTL